VAPARDEQEVAGGALYVYGIVPAEVRPALHGAPSVEAGAPVELVGAERFSVLVSRVSSSLFADANGGGEDLAWLEAPVRAHQEVLERALASGPVIPMRFGTVVADEAALVAYVDERREGLLATLSELEGKREWGVKVVADWERLRERLREEGERAEAAPLSEGAAYLARKRDDRRLEERLEAFTADVADRIHVELAGLAVRAATVAQVLAPLDDRRKLLLNAAYLVDVDREEAFRRTVDDLRRRFADGGIGLALSGPWPPYSFVAEGLER
jgi:hypothetical protein